MAIMSRTMPDGQPRMNAWDPKLAGERKQIIKMMLINLALVTAACWGILSIYFGSYFRQTENVYRLTVRVLDLDTQYAATVPGAPAAILGPAVLEAIQTNLKEMPDFHLGWQIASADELSTLQVTQGGQGINATAYATNLVLDQTVFAAIIINPNATVLATEAAQQGNTAYDPRGAISFIYEEARDFYSENQYVSLLANELINSAIAMASMRFVTRFANAAAPATNGGTANATSLSTALMGNALSYPFLYSQFNLRPFDQLAGEAATTAGLIYLIILTFFSSPIWQKAFEPLRKRITLSSQLILQLGVPILAYFWISLNYSLVTLAFHVHMTRKYGYGGFMLYWASNWTAMTALGLVMETMLRIAGPLGFPFFLLFWVVTNVSTVFLDLSDEDPFYLYGFALPVWNAVDTAKSILFGTKFHMTQNFLVNLAWVICASIVLLLVAAYQRHKEDEQELQGMIEKINEGRAGESS
ncbi:MAG: hypothetical protein CYPHOPRED_005864 [Cyphobasidiales sp. Tagirdzhanova-0007]|nr:MAG: hypothetical protein CYPHOPRED_005864 [Cyphobasidiales sp. Tagirdzhanova-0007]